MGQPTDRARTILFTDVEGSTALRSRAGDAAADDILGIHQSIVRTELERHGGSAILFLGDGFLAAFPTPAAALQAAVAVQRALDEHNAQDPARQLLVRIGVHHGEVLERDGNLYGQAVHAAARVTAEAVGGQVLVSADVHGLLDGHTDIAFADRGLFWLKGFPQRWRLYEAQWRTDGGAATPESPEPGTSAFVEREEERADLRRWVDAARGGQGCLVLVAGEAGVGKTRLLEEVQADAQRLGMLALAGHSAETSVTPYLPFVELLEQALIAPSSPLELREAVGDVAAEISRLVPGLRRVLPGIPAPVDLPPEQARRYLWNSVLEFLERASRRHPLLLVVEDLHWADESTMLLLEYLAPRLRALPVLVVGTYRDTEVGVSHPLSTMLHQLQRRRLVTRIALRRLSRDGVRSIVQSLAGQPAPAGLVDAIYAETDGNPFFVEEVYLHLEESGALLDADGRFRTDLAIDELDVPETIRLAVGGRLARLSEPTREALAAAAVVGRAFPTEVASRVAAQDIDTFAEAMDEAERARLVAPAKDGRLSFVHELIRQTLLADLSMVRRQRLHAHAADAIEDAFADDLDAHAADLTYHLSRSGPGVDPARLVRSLRVAGDWAVQAAAFEDAVAHFEHALSLLRPEEVSLRAELSERLAMARRSVGAWDEALAAMNEALELYESLGDLEAVGRLSWTMAYQLSWATRFEEAVQVAQRGLGALGESANPDRARLLSAAGWVMGLAGDYDTATAMFTQARALAERLGDKRALADVLHMETIQDFGYARFTEGIDAGMQAAVVLEADGALWDLCSVLSFVLYQAGAIARMEQAAELAARVDPLAARLGHLGAQFLSLAQRVRSDGVLPVDFARVRRIAREQIEVCERGGLPWLYVGYLYLGFAAHWSGDWDEAERQLRRAAELEAPGAFSGQGLTHLALHLAYEGRRAEVLEILEQRRGVLPRADAVNSLGSWNTMCNLVEALYVVGERSEAAALEPLMSAALALNEPWISFDCRSLHTRAAIAAAAGGRWEAAEEQFAAARDAAERVDNRIELVDIGRLHAMMLLDRDGPGDRQRAHAQLREAAGAYAGLGMPRHVTLTEALLADR